MDTSIIDSGWLCYILSVIDTKRRLDEMKSEIEETLRAINTGYTNTIISHFVSCYESGFFPKKGSVDEIDMKPADHPEVAPKAMAINKYINENAMEMTKMNELWTKYQLWPEDNIFSRKELKILTGVKYGNENDEKLKKFEEELKETDKLIEEKCSKIACLDLFDNEESKAMELLRKVPDLDACLSSLTDCLDLREDFLWKQRDYKRERKGVLHNLILQFDILPVCNDHKDEYDWAVQIGFF